VAAPDGSRTHNLQNTVLGSTVELQATLKHIANRVILAAHIRGHSYAAPTVPYRIYLAGIDGQGHPPGSEGGNREGHIGTAVTGAAIFTVDGVGAVVIDGQPYALVVRISHLGGGIGGG
jgi:hypothetical protein